MPATGPRPNSPVDQDLQRLYNEVWAGFESEKPNPPSRDELEGLYGDYLGGRDSPLTHPVNKTLPTNHQQYYAQEGLPPTPVHQANSSKNSGVRRLPPTPGSSSSSPTTPISMPIPEPYYDSNSPQRPAHYTADSYATTISSTSTSSSTDLLKKATTGSANGRRLPQAPSGGGYPNGSQPATNGRPSPLPGLPADPRPTSSPTSPHPSLSRGGGSYSASSGGPPYRPPGALPPAVPGYQENTPSVGQALSSSGFDIYNMDNRNVSNGHLHQQQQPYRQQHQQYQPQQQHAYSNPSMHLLTLLRTQVAKTWQL
ncbi:hypothetical protein BDQ17DRAFT_1468681 [Cyathus striatus]|nr:hypothetical protein BDQ17DRAFT_1468681 [Cyathus striatus]